MTSVCTVLSGIITAHSVWKRVALNALTGPNVLPSASKPLILIPQAGQVNRVGTNEIQVKNIRGTEGNKESIQ